MKWRVFGVIALVPLVVAGSAAFFFFREGPDTLRLKKIMENILVHDADPRPYGSFLRAHDASLDKYHLPQQELYSYQGHTLPGTMAWKCSRWEDWTDCDFYLQAALEKKRDNLTLQALISEAKALNKPQLVASITGEELHKLDPWWGVDFLIATNHLDEAFSRALELIKSSVENGPNDGNGLITSRCFCRTFEIYYRRKEYKKIDLEMQGVFNLGFATSDEYLKQAIALGVMGDMCDVLSDYVIAAHFAMKAADELHDEESFKNGNHLVSTLSTNSQKSPAQQNGIASISFRSSMLNSARLR